MIEHGKIVATLSIYSKQSDDALSGRFFRSAREDVACTRRPFDIARSAMTWSTSRYPGSLGRCGGTVCQKAIRPD